MYITKIIITSIVGIFIFCYIVTDYINQRSWIKSLCDQIQHQEEEDIPKLK